MARRRKKQAPLKQLVSKKDRRHQVAQASRGPDGCPMVGVFGTSQPVRSKPTCEARRARDLARLVNSPSIKVCSPVCWELGRVRSVEGSHASNTTRQILKCDI